jgi:putative spermidine/putrescine transport system ATP-binding protein
MRDGLVRQVGTPEQLYARPAHADVAEFMGYRNLIRSQVSGMGSVNIGGASFQGTPVAPSANGDAVVAIRPEDLRVAADGPLAAKVESAQYHGDNFYCFGRAADGTELYFCCARRISKGDAVRLAADPERVLIYAEAVT